MFDLERAGSTPVMRTLLTDNQIITFLYVNIFVNIFLEQIPYSLVLYPKLLYNHLESSIFNCCFRYCLLHFNLKLKISKSSY